VGGGVGRTKEAERRIQAKGYKLNECNGFHFMSTAAVEASNMVPFLLTALPQKVVIWFGPGDNVDRPTAFHKSVSTYLLLGG
jgi:hypothetical protein